MFFTGKDKKSGSSKVLSEAEIQKKLYGDYETTSAGVLSSSHEVKMSGPAFESQTVPKRDPFSGVTVKSPSFGAHSKPEILVSKPSAHPASFGDHSARKPFSSQPGSAVPLRSQASTDWKKNALKAGQVVLGFVAGVLWKLGSYLVQTLDFILRILDPRKPQARKILYTITACVLVAALFFGVFRLNAQRKKAMMGELRPAALSEVSVPKPAVVPPAVLPSALSEVPPAPNSAQNEGPETALPELDNSGNTSMSVPSAAVGGRYVIQVATYAILDDANRVVQSFNQAGFTAFYKKQVRNSTGHSFYPIYLGRFETSAQAQKALTKFRKASVARPFQDSFIRTLE